MDFACVDGCSKCCVEREYYPSIKFGKIGVLILPDEKPRIESLAEKHSVRAVILPRIGISSGKIKPERILAYQLMGVEPNGNTCPFLDIEGSGRSPHGGYKCKIYEDRPLACRAYPLMETSPPTLDPKCKFCETCSTVDGNIHSETESLIKIKSGMATEAKCLWRYATGIGDSSYANQIRTGWFLI
ncbi:MAG: YkgJ family cysteine cluster protein [Patescibacteria group bacterium]|nr:YkgJ family cysteine cluster protein [Patescibacteria group bacterium]